MNKLIFEAPNLTRCGVSQPWTARHILPSGHNIFRTSQRFRSERSRCGKFMKKSRLRSSMFALGESYFTEAMIPDREVAFALDFGSDCKIAKYCIRKGMNIRIFILYHVIDCPDPHYGQVLKVTWILLIGIVKFHSAPTFCRLLKCWSPQTESRSFEDQKM